LIRAISGLYNKCAADKDKSGLIRLIDVNKSRCLLASFGGDRSSSGAEQARLNYEYFAISAFDIMYLN